MVTRHRLLSIFFLMGLCQQSVHAASGVTLTIDGLMNSDGQLVIQLYDKSAHWMSDESSEMVQRFTVPLASSEPEQPVSITLPISEGDYAIYLYHDKNLNNKMESNWIGMPKEPVGVSNNAKGKMGPPSFESAKFTVAQGETEQHITLINF